MQRFYDLSFKKQLERWENVIRVLKDLPAHERKKHWDMGTFGEKTACGTVACAAGHCGMDPWFRKQGFKLDLELKKVEDIFYEEHGWENADQRDSVEVRVWARKITDLYSFFGDGYTIFLDGKTRSVETVIKEVKNHIKSMKGDEE